ncbi:uncharacterized protein PHALS_07336 [Plasmopara halstedii]|uniref:Uncharacterized protein n=1 Tax=Plasmopara halstedii TaxID=4781 RepID=A0A0P1B485_PLAHL|nr:uncharacterized protein PHALS_07336 [Plasmopara halstedii]CEG49578.1 hypothetical protein PHALS_07336 [Plasmopara halstedii]|eukprot:XP_024585947.1 hypothetical protein PHALS_07336 [Plasmopara halstedii]
MTNLNHFGFDGFNPGMPTPPLRDLGGRVASVRAFVDPTLRDIQKSAALSKKLRDLTFLV